MKHKRKTALVLAALILTLSVCGCSSGAQRTIKLEDANVGLVLYKSEFQAIGNQHPDFTYGEISYFDEYYNAQMALTANRIDAFYADYASANEMLRSTGDPEDYNIYRVQMSSTLWSSNWCSPSAAGVSEDITLAEEYRAWLEEFKTTDTYADIVRRMRSTRYEMYERVDVAAVSSDEVVRTLKIGFLADNVPYSLIDSDVNPYGPSIEIACHFANAMGYAVEFADTTVPTAIPSLASGRMDLYYLLSAYSEDGSIKNSNPAVVSDFMLFPNDFVLVTRADTVIEGLELIGN